VAAQTLVICIAGYNLYCSWSIAYLRCADKYAELYDAWFALSSASVCPPSQAKQHQAERVVWAADRFRSGTRFAAAMKNKIVSAARAFIRFAPDDGRAALRESPLSLEWKLY
jgi:hypothetical protein